MDGPPLEPALMVIPAEMGRLMPMHVAVSPGGMITSVGPTLHKVLGGGVIVGRDLFAVLTVRRPAGIHTVAGLADRRAQRLRLHPNGRPEDMLRGLAVVMADGGLMLNLSFGIDVIEATRRHALTDADFAATDLTMELMYVVEAKSAFTSELRQHALRLRGDKTVAEEQAMTDILTGLRNRRAADATLAALCDARTEFSLFNMDLDFFKAVNDTLGHAAGDHVLRVVAEVLATEIRASDTAARVGGDEFIVIMPQMTDAPRLARIAQRIITRICAPIPHEGGVAKVSASIGITLSTLYESPSPEGMLADADAALYASKRAGRARATFFTPEMPREG